MHCKIARRAKRNRTPRKTSAIAHRRERAARRSPMPARTRKWVCGWPQPAAPRSIFASRRKPASPAFQARFLTRRRGAAKPKSGRKKPPRRRVLEATKFARRRACARAISADITRRFARENPVSKNALCALGAFGAKKSKRFVARLLRTDKVFVYFT